MKNVQTKILMGASLLAACGFSNAATIAMSPTASSVEGNIAALVSSSSASVTLPAATAAATAGTSTGGMAVTLGGTGYADGDIVTFRVAGAELRVSSLPAVDEFIMCRGPTTAGGAKADAVKLTITAVSSTGWTATVSRVNTASLNSETVCLLTKGGTLTTASTGVVDTAGTAYELLASSLQVPRTVTVNWTATTASGTVHDFLTYSAGNTATPIVAHYARSQYLVASVSPAGSLLINPSATTTRPARTHWVDTCAGRAQRQAINSVLADGSAANRTAPTETCTGTKQSGYTASRATSQLGVLVLDNSPLLAGATGDFGGANRTLQNRVATTNNLVISWRGNFSFLDNNGDGVCTLADTTSGYARVSVKDGELSQVGGTAAQSDANVVAIASDCSEIQTTVAGFNGGSGTGSAYQYLYFTVGNGGSSTYGSAGAREIPVQTITATVTYRTAAAAVLSTNTAAVGSYSYDSQSAAINYMPYGPGISRIVYVTSSATSPVSISAVNESGTSCSSTNFPAVTATANSPTSLSTAMDAGVAACYGASYNGKVKFTVSLTQIRSRGQYTLALPELTMTPRRPNAAALGVFGNNTGVTAGAGTANTGSYAARTVLQQVADFTATGGASTADTTAAAGNNEGVVGTIANATGTIDRVGDAFEIYSAYNVNGNRVQVTNETNGR